MNRHRLRVLFLLAACAYLLGSGLYAALARRDREAPAPPPAPREASYPYHGPAFASLVSESYSRGGRSETEEFFRWADRAYQSSQLQPAGKAQLTLEAALDAEKKELAAITDPTRRAARELDLAAWLHRMVKTILPKFSLERGFEFHYAVERGERQCFLQSVLIASMLQRMGADAGVVMIFKNPAGQESNLGHAAVLLKLSTGRDVLVDASDPTPFIRHRGLFARTPDYRFLLPTYTQKSSRISSYRVVGGKKTLPAQRVRPLDLAFLRSQFWYYHGERAVGGIFSAHPTAAGLQASARSLKESVRICPRNPLATYMLGRVYLRERQAAKGRAVLVAARQLYTRFGWQPPGLQEALSASAARAATPRA